ncbi:MAG: mechanosensitive ion channel family protein [Pseudomonadota bacterium]|nr:mechanosensitive ion channel family protein [Pseudomonadota bacterium]
MLVPALLLAPVSAVAAQQSPDPDAAALAAAVATDTRQDARIAAAVRARLLRQPALQSVTVQVASGVVELGGEVLETEQRTLAATLAKEVEGVSEVDNGIAISSDLGTRLSAALVEAQDKLLRLVAAIPLLVVAIAIVVLAWWLGRRVGRRKLRWLPGRSDNPYLDGLLRRVAQALVVIIGLVLALNLLGATALVGAVLGSAGVVGLVLGFAFKDVAENYIAGVLLSLRRPFAPGDHLLIDPYEGKVIAVTARTTLLMTLDGNELSLPNGLVFRSVVTNFTANPKRRFDFALPVDPGESLSRARDLALEAMARVDGVLADPGPSWSADGYAAKGLDLRFFGWVDQRSNDVGKVRSEALRAVRGAFARVDVHGPEAVRYRREDKPAAHEDAVVDTSVNRDIDAQLAAAQRASDSDLLTPPPATPK